MSNHPSDAKNPIPESASPHPRGGAIRWLGGGIFDLFSSVRFGVILMVLLFIYMSIGSAGILYPVALNIFQAASWEHEQIRQWRLFEMTEFEWFHWWPFDVLLALIALTLVVTTLRRIRLSVVNLGVWMIHSGIIILIIGSLIYFGTKVEGDTAIARRMVVIQLLDDAGQPVGPPERLSVFAGNGITVGSGNDRFEVLVASTDPEWELLSGDDKGERAYSVSLFVQSAERSFIRQVIAGHPEYTEDLVSTEDSEQPWARAVKLTGEPTIEPRLLVTLEYAPQEWFYLSNQLSKNWALYLREKGSTEWIERPIPASSPLDPDKEGVPLYGDYVADTTSVFTRLTHRTLSSDPIDVEVKPVSPKDPLPGTILKLDSYLRYAIMQSRWDPGPPGSDFNPMFEFELVVPGQQPQQNRLLALDPAQSTTENGAIAFKYAASDAELEALRQPRTLQVELPALGIDESRSFAELTSGDPWQVGDTGYTLELVSVQDDIVLASGTASVAFVDITTPEGESFRRWVFSDPTLTRDLADDGAMPSGEGELLRDDAIQISYRPGRGAAVLLFVAGPDPEQLRSVDFISSPEGNVLDLVKGTPLELTAGIKINPEKYLPRAQLRTAPLIVPRTQRQREAGNHFSWVRVELPGGEHRWLQFHKYVFEAASSRLSRVSYDPSTVSVRMPDGTWKDVEMVFSRQRMRLPDEIALETFELDSNIGGITAEQGSIRDYRSRVRFLEDGTWSKPQPISMNKPVEHGGFWYFQAQWDPPEPARGEGELASRGLNYTVLGVGNRNGVYVQLIGCVIAVIGMIYAFYVKPAIKRSRQRRVAEHLAENAS